MAKSKTKQHWVERRLKLGSHLSVSPICLGIVHHPSMVTRAFDAGINFFFLTADMHWPYYEATRQGLADLLKKRPKARKDLVVAGAAYVTQPEFCSMPFTEIIEHIPGLERLDLLVAGGAYGHNLGGRMPVFHRHRESNFIGCTSIGASFHDREAARWAVSSSAVDIAFVRFNAGHPGAAWDLFPHLARPRNALVYNFNTTHGFVSQDQAKKLAPKSKWLPGITDHYRFALSQSAIDGLMVALEGDDHLDELIRATDLGPLSLDEQHFLVDLAAKADQSQSPPA
ncbi:MAG: hypothetical protein QM723_26480 [Myxococcaceae bacterium]